MTWKNSSTYVVFHIGEKHARVCAWLSIRFLPIANVEADNKCFKEIL